MGHNKLYVKVYCTPNLIVKVRPREIRKYQRSQQIIERNSRIKHD